MMNGVSTRLQATPVSWLAVPQLKPLATPRNPGGALSASLEADDGPETEIPVASSGVAVPGSPVVSSGSIKVAPKAAQRPARGQDAD